MGTRLCPILVLRRMLRSRLFGAFLLSAANARWYQNLQCRLHIGLRKILPDVE